MTWGCKSVSGSIYPGTLISAARDLTHQGVGVVCLAIYVTICTLHNISWSSYVALCLDERSAHDITTGLMTGMGWI